MQKLPATQLDEAFVNLGRAAVMSIEFEVRVQGRLDIDRLNRALRVAVSQHPMARAKLAPIRWWSPRMKWLLPDEADHVALEVTDEPAEEVRHRLQSAAPDLFSSPPLLAALVREDGGDRFMVNLHHAALDGKSAVRLMSSVALAYAGEHDELAGPPVAEARKLWRIAGSRNVREAWVRFWAMTVDFACRWGSTRLAPADGSDTGRNSVVSHLRLSGAEVASACGHRAPGATVNDLALAAYALAIVRWNGALGKRSRRRVPLLMPVNLRPSEWSGEVASNFSSYLTVYVPTRITDLAEATAAVHRRTATVKANGAAGWIVDFLGLGTPLPGLIKRGLIVLLPFLSRQFILSNLGRVHIPDFGPGGAVTEVWFSPPHLAPGMPLALGVTGVGEEIFISLRGDRRRLSQEALDRFVETLRDTMTGAPVPSGTVSA